MRFAITEKKIFPSTFNKAMPLNWLMLWESFSFGMKVVTALLHAGGMDWVFQAEHIILHKKLQGPGAVFVDFVWHTIWSRR